MLVKVNPGFRLAGPDGCAGEGKTIVVPDEIAEAMIDGGYVSSVDGSYVARPKRETRTTAPSENASLDADGEEKTPAQKAAETKARKAAEAAAKAAAAK